MQVSRKAKTGALCAVGALVCFVLARFASIGWAWGHNSVGWIFIFAALALLLVGLSNLLAPLPWYKRPQTPIDDPDHTLNVERKRNIDR